MSSGIGVLSLVMMIVLSRCGGAARVLVVLLVVLEGLDSFLEATFTQDCWRATSGGGMRAGSPGGGLKPPGQQGRREVVGAWQTG